MKPRRELLTWLNSDLDEAIAEGAGALLDATTQYLADAGPTRVLDDPPAVIFDPMAAATFHPAPITLPTRRSGRGASKPIAAERPWWSPSEIADSIRRGDVSRAEIAQEYRGRIAAWNPILNAFIRVTLDETEAGDGKGSRNGRLAGAPIGLQDVVCTAGIGTTAGSEILRDFVPAVDATAWSLLAADGALLAGKLNTQEFAAGTTGENCHYGAVRNPWDPTKHAGGAAGGSAAAVATGLLSAAVGTDPGGSTRVPAAHCGVVGLKPTFGAMDRTGVIPLTWTTETLGVIAQTVAGTAVVSDVLLDGRARSRYGASCEEAARRGSGRSRLELRVGVPVNWLEMGLDPGVERAYRQALAELRSLGATIHDVELPDAALIAPAHRTIAFSEASTIHEEFIQDHADNYGSNIRERQEAGRGVMASEYLKAFRLRGQFCREFSEVWREVHVIVMPTSPVPAAPIGTTTISTGPRGEEPTHTVYTRYAAPMNTMGLPALSVPCGFTEDGLPVGLQLCGPPHSEPLLFFIASAYESVTPWHLRHPELPANQLPANQLPANKLVRN